MAKKTTEAKSQISPENPPAKARKKPVADQPEIENRRETLARGIGQSELLNIKHLERERFTQIDTGLVAHPYFLRPCRVKILMLVDNGISYNQFYFGLSEVLDTLRMNPEWWVNFEVTRAHRQADPNPPVAGSPADILYGTHFSGFRFNQSGFNLNDYHQVWFYGFNSNTTFPTALAPGELEILFRWMDEKQGGVFATGDHATLGQSLCSQIPRVRGMRKWTLASGVPPFSGPTRHDTLIKGHDFADTAGVDESTRYTFDDESDDIPMRIRLRWYWHHHCSHHHLHPAHLHRPYIVTRSPHPVLCGTHGPINILPDHPHEGEVVVPSVLTDSPTHGAYSAREYPDLDGSPLSPQIIAWARVQDDITDTNSFKHAADSGEFGAIGAYNGHCVNVGRVVTDSTWHHWFDVNLTGRMFFGSDVSGGNETGDPRKLNGFNDTLAGEAALARIKNYYRNVAIWLAPPGSQKCMARRGLWGSIFRYPLIEELQAHLPIQVIGHYAIDALGRFAGQCNVKRWWPLFIEEFPFKLFFDPERIKVPVQGLTLLDEFMIGGIVQQMLVAREERFLPGKHPSDRELDEMAARGVQVGVRALLEQIEQVNATNQHIAGLLQKVIRKSSKAD